MFEPLDPVKLRGVASMLALELNQRLRDRNITMVGTHTSLTSMCSRLLASTRHYRPLRAGYVKRPACSCMALKPSAVILGVPSASRWLPAHGHWPLQQGVQCLCINAILMGA